MQQKISLYLDLEEGRAMSGEIKIPMMRGIRMDVLLEVKERKRDGAWLPYERNILTVYGVATDSGGNILGLFPDGGDK